MIYTSRRKILGKTLLDLSKYIIFAGVIALALHKLDWATGTILIIVSIITAVSGIYLIPKTDESNKSDSSD